MPTLGAGWSRRRGGRSPRDACEARAQARPSRDPASTQGHQAATLSEQVLLGGRGGGDEEEAAATAADAAAEEESAPERRPRSGRTGPTVVWAAPLLGSGAGVAAPGRPHPGSAPAATPRLPSGRAQASRGLPRPRSATRPSSLRVGGGSRRPPCSSPRRSPTPRVLRAPCVSSPQCQWAGGLSRTDGREIGNRRSALGQHARQQRDTLKP